MTPQDVARGVCAMPTSKNSYFVEAPGDSWLSLSWHLALRPRPPQSALGQLPYSCPCSCSWPTAPGSYTVCYLVLTLLQKLRGQKLLYWKSFFPWFLISQVNVNNLLHSFTFHIQSRHVKISKIQPSKGYQPQGATKCIYALYNKRHKTPGKATNSNNVPTAVGFSRAKSF